MCQVLSVSRSGYYDWKSRSPSARAQANEALLKQIEQVHERSRQCYGAYKTWRALIAQGMPCGRHRVARLRRHAGIEAKRKRRFRITTKAREGVQPAPNVLEQSFSTQAPNRVWATDITFVPTAQGWLYLAVIVDLYSRRVVGWSMSESMDQQLVLGALHMALAHRRPQQPLLHHSDQGRQYSAAAYQAVLAEHGIEVSMSRRGNCYDNAVAESFFSTLKNELVHHCNFKTRGEARLAIFEFIEVFYNRERRHASLDFVSPVEYESRAGVS
jgi:transposase InsO family protein